MLLKCSADTTAFDGAGARWPFQTLEKELLDFAGIVTAMLFQ